jgi:hypothetical protein
MPILARLCAACHAAAPFLRAGAYAALAFHALHTGAWPWYALLVLLELIE